MGHGQMIWQRDQAVRLADLGHPLFPDGGADRQQDARRLRTVRPGMRGGGGTGGQRPGSSGGGRRGCGAVFGLRGCAAVPRYGGADLHHFHRPAGDPAGKEAVVPGGGGRGAVSGSRRDLRDPVPGSPGPCHRLGRGGHFAGSRQPGTTCRCFRPDRSIWTRTACWYWARRCCWRWGT